MHLVLISASLLLVIAVPVAKSDDFSCGSPPDIKHAIIADVADRLRNVHEIYAEVFYVCQSGYVASGTSRIVKCLLFAGRAEWTEPQFSCKITTCNPPKDIANGHVTALSYEYGSELNYKCDEGFSLSTNETIYCTEDGTWSKTNVTCEEPCTIQYIANGAIGKYVRKGLYGPRTMVFEAITIGTVAEEDEDLYLQCTEGYEAGDTEKQETKVTCTEGKWSVELQCKPAPCRSDVELFALYAKPVSINREHGGTVSFECFPDYKKVRNETKICEYGEWKGYRPICRGTKCDVKSLSFPGVVKGSKPYFSEGEVFNYTCDYPRYRLPVGHSGQIKCVDGGIWAADLPFCIAASCSKPPPPIENGNVTDLSMVHRAVVNYVCEEPYVLEGESLVQCTFGDWIGEPPRCKDSRCYLKDLKSLAHVSAETPSTTLSNNTLNVICDEDYTARSELPFCQDGEWNLYNDSPCEEIPCIIEFVANGVIGKYVRKGYNGPRSTVFEEINIGTIVEEDEDLYLQCSEGYEAGGSVKRETEVSCSKGEWSVELSCKPASCSDIPISLFAKAVNISYEHGGTVSYECLPDLEKVVQETVICEYGEWKGKTPICKATKCFVKSLSFPGVVQGSEPSFSEGEVFNYTCDYPRYRLPVGHSGQIKCVDGMWQTDFPLCIAASCSDPPPPIEHGSVKDLSMVHRAVVNYVCEDPYVLEGESLVQCTFGDWIGQPPRCRDSRCYLKDLNSLAHVSPETQSITLSSDTLNVICDQGYSARSELPFCQDGEWNPYHDSPCEEKDCQIPRVSYGSIKEQVLGEWEYSFRLLRYQRSTHFRRIPAGNVVSPNTILFLCCYRPYSALGTGEKRVEIKCSRGRWTPDPICLRNGQMQFPITSE